MKYDVVVVGAGPIGSIAARYAAKNGAKTLIIEEHGEIGSPVQCAGLISTRALEECEIEEGDFIDGRMKGAYIYSPDGKELGVHGNQVKAYVINRKMFDRTLATRAVEAGSDLLLKTRAQGLSRKKEGMVLEVKDASIEAGVVIGADGLQSRIARWAGLGRVEKVLSGIQIEAPYSFKDPEYVEIYLGNKVAPGFFAWAIPASKDIARIGLCIDPDKNPAQHYLKRLLESHPVVSKRYLGSATDLVMGGIPLGPQPRTINDGVMIVGDAAGQVKPTTGGGIYMGAVCAKIAGEVAAKAAKEGDIGAARLEEYEKRWRAAIGRELAIGMRIHQTFGHLSDKSLNELIGFFQDPKISALITSYGDMDHPSILLARLLKEGNKIQMLGLLGSTLKALISTSRIL